MTTFMTKTLMSAYIAAAASKTNPEAITTVASVAKRQTLTFSAGTWRCTMEASMSEPPVVAWPRSTSPKPAPHKTPPKTAESSTSSVIAGTGR